MKTFTSIACFGILAVLGASAQTLSITTMAGYAGKGSADGVGSGALFFNPQGVAVDGAGNVYVADSGNNIIRVISSAGVSRTLAGTAGVSGSVDGTGTNALFNQPSGIALDSSTNIYVSDYGNNTIREITPFGQVTTIAGSAGVAGSANLTGTNALFFHPMGLAVDSSFNVYVADYGNNLIRKITLARVVTTLAGSGTAGSANGTGTSAQFNEPEGVTLDTLGNVYVADTGNSAIREISSLGAVTTIAGSPGTAGSTDATGTNALFYQPVGITINSSGILYVSDYFNNTIRQISSGAVTTLAGTPGLAGSADGSNNLARFWAPQGLAVSSAGTVYIADSANSAIRTMTPAGVVTTFAGSPSDGSSNNVTTLARFYSPQNVAVDSANNVYIADTLNSVIRKITAAGAVSILAGNVGVFGSEDGAATNALFAGPQGVAVDSSGNVYVADTGNSTIRKITSSGVVSTLAGLAGNPGNADGTGTSAQFSEPEGVAVDSSKNVYVADTWNHTIRKITSGGVSSTLAGLPGTFGSFDGTNGAARFNCPTGVAVDSSGNLYVTDYNNNTIRKVTPAGVVSTLAGWAGMWGSVDAANANALFFAPAGISVDNTGNLYVVDSGNDTLRKVTPSGTNWVVVTVAGSPGVSGSSDGTGSSAQFYYPAGVTVGGSGFVYVADSGNNTIRFTGILAPTIATQPQNQTNVIGASSTFSVTATDGAPLSYSWQYDGYAVGATGTLSAFTASQAGSYAVLVSNAAGTTLSSTATLTLTNPSAGSFNSMQLSSSGAVTLSGTGTPSARYEIDSSTNLSTWTTLVVFTNSSGSTFQYTNPGPQLPYLFFRLNP